MSRGRIVASGMPSHLIAAHAAEVRVRFTSTQPVPWLSGVRCVREVRRRRDVVEVTGEGPVLAHVGAALVGHGIAPDDLRAERMTLEDVFLRLTGSPSEVG